MLISLASGNDISPQKKNGTMSNIHKHLSTKKMRAIVKILMLVFGSLTLIFLEFGPFKFHGICAQIWVATMLFHIYQNKNSLFK